MKRIIDGKTYNTETATYIAYGHHDDGCTRSYHFSETLYQTRNGAFFLEGDGGGIVIGASHSTAPMGVVPAVALSH